MPLLPLRPHQQVALDGIKRSVSAGKRRPVLLLPTGAGKTVVAAHMILGALAKRKRVAFCVPALSLIDQTFSRFSENGIEIGDMGVMQADHPWRRPNAPVQICSIQTIAKRGFPEVDFTIVDENHLRFEAIDKWMASAPEKIFVGLSATPWARGMGDHWDDLIIPTSIAELIDQGYLSKFRVFAPSHPDLSGVKIVAGDYHEGQLSERMSGAKIVADVVTTWLERGDNQPTLCFAVDRGHAQLLHDQFGSVGVTSAYVDANTDREERARIIAAFHRGELKVINSIGTMTTGVDVDCRCIIMARPTKSEILFVQCIGRGLRPAAGKEFCTILDHSDTHLRLGMVTDIFHDTLRTAAGEAREKKEKSDKAPTPLECVACACLIPLRAPECPNCGYVPRRASRVQVEQGELIELGAGAAKSKREPALVKLAAMGEQAVYSQLLAMQGEKKDGWVSFKFKTVFGRWPPRWLSRQHDEPSNALRSWVRYEQIKWAKSRPAQRYDGADSEALAYAD
jgi:DNA repair protein RadD